MSMALFHQKNDLIQRWKQIPQGLLTWEFLTLFAMIFVFLKPKNMYLIRPNQYSLWLMAKSKKKKNQYFQVE